MNAKRFNVVSLITKINNNYNNKYIFFIKTLFYNIIVIELNITRLIPTDASRRVERGRISPCAACFRARKSLCTHTRITYPRTTPRTPAASSENVHKTRRARLRIVGGGGGGDAASGALE